MLQPPSIMLLLMPNITSEERRAFAKTVASMVLLRTLPVMAAVAAQAAAEHGQSGQSEPNNANDIGMLIVAA